MSSKPEKVEAIIAVADKPNLKGVVFTAEVLRGMADGKTKFWDEAQQVLIYRGELPPKEP